MEWYTRICIYHHNVSEGGFGLVFWECMYISLLKTGVYPRKRLTIQQILRRERPQER